MWATQFAREVKVQLRDVYGLTPSRVVDGELCFDRVPDGLYPMTIDGVEYHGIAFIGQRFLMLDIKKPAVQSQGVSAS